jgi:hypothetical protein
MATQYQNAIDKQIAAIGLIHGLTVVTRNVKDFESTGVQTLNPPSFFVVEALHKNRPYKTAVPTLLPCRACANTTSAIFLIGKPRLKPASQILAIGEKIHSFAHGHHFAVSDESENSVIVAGPIAKSVLLQKCH